MGRSHQALIDLNHAIKLNSADARAYLLRAHAYKQLGDFTHELKDSAMAKELGAKVRGQVAPQPLTD
jgi:Tfp pilus assembly protein PilF